MDWLELKVPPVAQVVALAVAMWGISVLSPFGPFTVPGRRLIAVSLLAAGAVVGLTAVLQFRSASTTVDPRKPDAASTIVSAGVYGWSRNPMYLALLFGLASWAIYLAHTLGLLLLPVFVLYMNRFQIRPEERALRESFGAEYSAYAESVRRWI